MSLKLLLVLFTVFCIFGSIEGMCGFDKMLVCWYIESPGTLESEIKEPLEKAKSKDNLEIELNHFYNMSCLASAALFKGKSIKRLQLGRSELDSWYCPDDKGDREAFRNVQQLGLVNIKGLDHWNWSEVNEYTGKSVKVLVIRQSPSVRLTPHFREFYGQNVRTIYLSNIEDLQLEDQSLECPNCDEITVMFSNVGDLRKEVFGRGLEQLRHLNLFGNQIERIPKDLFQNINFSGQGDRTLVYPYSGTYFVRDGKVFSSRDYRTFSFQLGSNPLKRLDAETFQPLKDNYEKIVIAFDNQMGTFNCDCEFGWLFDPKFDIDAFNCSNSEGVNVYLKDFFETKQCLNRVIDVFMKFLLNLSPLNYDFSNTNSNSSSIFLN